MREMHAASSLDSAEQVAEWTSKIRSGGKPAKQSRKSTKAAKPDALIALQPLKDNQLPPDSLEDVIVRRGSSRRFIHKPISFAQLSTILDRSIRGLPADFLPGSSRAGAPAPQGTLLNDVYIIVNDVDGLAPGSYVYHRDNKSLELLRKGNFRKLSGYLGLEQQLPGDASVDIFFLADLNKILEQYGNRGYRAVQLEAGILGGRIYLAAYAQRLGATGLTFYDDDVVRFFSPHAEGKSAIFLVAVGKSS